MKIKRFFASDMRRAMALVRAEHGADAVIMSSTVVDGGVEIVSAVDYDARLVTELAEHSPAAPAAPTVMAEEPAAPRPQPKIEWSPDPALQAMQRELAAMKQMLKEQFAHLAWADMKTFDPERALLQRRVAALGFEPELVEALTDEAFAAATDAVACADDAHEAETWRSVLRGIANRVAVLERDPIETGGVIALVGPTGVGKTTTIAKLAARHCLRFGPDSMALISTDSYRVGAQRQLEVFGAILGVPVRRADGPAELAELLHEQRHRRLVLIDTAGLAPRDCRIAESMAALREIAGIATFLVLPANMQAAVMREAVQVFGAGGLSGAVLTKLDESSGLGAALSVVIESGLPVAWLCEGQRVPEDLKLARTMHVVGWASSPPDVTVAAPGRPSQPVPPQPASLRRPHAEVDHAAA
jgi:flagellar biosynthesis protein FlhF